MFCTSADDLVDDSVNTFISFHSNITFSINEIEYIFGCVLLFVDVGSYLICCATVFFLDFISGL